jgi:histidine phosphotransferase ChpT
MVESIKLLELMSARMFHDLAGPVGAVNNSIDFIEEDNPAIKEKALKLVKISSHEAILRLKFFRQAYGNLGENEINLNIIRDLINEFIENSKVTLNWQVEDINVGSYIAKTILNFVIIALASMIQGGILIIEYQVDQLKITFQANNIIFSQETKFLLTGDLSYINLSSANIQIYYTYMMLKEAKANLKINQSAEKLEFTITSIK